MLNLINQKHERKCIKKFIRNRDRMRKIKKGSKVLINTISKIDYRTKLNSLTLATKML